jgi:hypothetical protein
MAIASGLDALVGYGLEATPGTRQAPTRSVEHVTFAARLGQDTIKRAGMRQSRRTGFGNKVGTRKIRLDVEHDLASTSADVLFRQFMGANVDAGANPYTHTMTMGALVEGDALTVQAGLPNEAGTVDCWEFTGVQPLSGSVSANITSTEPVRLRYNASAMAYDSGQTLHTATYQAAHDPFTALEGVVTINAVEYPVTEFEWSFDLGLATDRHVMRAATPQNPRYAREAGRRMYGMKVKSDYFDRTAYDRYRNGTETAVSVVFGSTTSRRITFTANAWTMEPDGPDITGPEMLSLGLPFEFLSTTSDNAALTIVIENTNATVS